MRAQSGYKYTPLVAGDINGDGYTNDRAFVFPTTTADTALQHGMSRLIAGASHETRDCLVDQAGRIAARNSCTAGGRADAHVALSPDSYLLHLGNRASVNVFLIKRAGRAG